MGSFADSTPGNSPQVAPQYGHHRVNVAAADVIANVPRGRGINMGAYRLANIQVLQTTGSGNPTVNVFFWSEAADAWVRTHTALTLAALGAGVSWEATVECNGRIMFVALTGTLTGGVNVHVSGYDMDHTL